MFDRTPEITIMKIRSTMVNHLGNNMTTKLFSVAAATAMLLAACAQPTAEPTKAPILLPPISRHVDYELELAIVIGAQGSRIPVANALDHVAGYAVYNDISSRKLVIAEGRSVRDGDGFYDWLMGKWQDNSGPMGPYLVTRDEVPNGDNLDMKLWVNGELRQNSNTSKMIFNIAEIVAFCSTLVTLQVGDIIATGTPSGVGDASGTYLKAGDVVRCEIEMLGVLENTVQGG